MRWLVVIGALLAADLVGAEELTIGRWCDRMLPTLSQELTIRVTEAGDVAALVRFSDGSSGSRPLIEEGGDVFRVVGSSSGDRYRIVRSTGDLQLIDDDGLIRVARRLENTPQDGDCLR